MTRHWQMAAFVAAGLAFVLPAAAQSAGSSGGVSSGTASSPGVSNHNDSETGVAVPGDAPVGSRTHRPAQIGTGDVGSSSTAGNAQGTGAGGPAYTDLSRSDRDSSAATGTGAASSGMTGATKLSKKLQDGLEELHAGDQAEVQSGQLAQQSASSPDVRAFGRRMVTDHGQNDQQLASLAQTLGVSLEGKAFTSKREDAQKSAKKLEGKSGAEFDKAYIDAMVKDHEKDSKGVKKLADQARKDGQTELAAFLDQTEHTMQSHLSQVKQLQASVKSASSSSSSTTGTGSSDKGY